MVFDGVAVYDGGAGISSEEQGHNQGKDGFRFVLMNSIVYLKRLVIFFLLKLGCYCR